MYSYLQIFAEDYGKIDSSLEKVVEKVIAFYIEMSVRLPCCALNVEEQIMYRVLLTQLRRYWQEEDPTPGMTGFYSKEWLEKNDMPGAYKQKLREDLDLVSVAAPSGNPIAWAHLESAILGELFSNFL